MTSDVLAEIRDFYDAIATGDVARAQAKLDAGKIVITEAESLPFGGEYRGIDGFHKLMRNLGGAWKRVRFDNFVFATGENRVVSEFVMTATVRATGAELKFPVIEVFELGDGKIVSIRPFYWDTSAICKAFGV